MQILKQVLGVDVAQKELVVTLGRLNKDLSKELYSYKVFRNTNPGIESLVKWVNKLTNKDVPVQYVGGYGSIPSEACILPGRAWI